MKLSHDFGPFDGHIWLNAAQQGPLPRQAAEEAQEAIIWKALPYELTAARFTDVPQRLKGALAQLIGSSVDEIILGNSASYGLHLLANGTAWNTGDEVLLVKGDFPADIFPWLALKGQGVRVRFVEPKNYLPTPEELESSLTPRTRLFCSTWVHSFSGMTADLAALGKLCRTNATIFVVNASQALGARPLAVSDVAVDALVSVGHKWLCGPYGTGFCWMKPELLRSLTYNQVYWQAEMMAEDLGKEGINIQKPKGLPTARTFDVFGTANFFNFKPWAASVEHLLTLDIGKIAEHNQRLVSHLIKGLNTEKFKLLSPRQGPERSTLVFLSHRDPKRNEEVYTRLKREGVDITFRQGKLRFAPHLYNTDEDIARALAVLNAF